MKVFSSTPLEKSRWPWPKMDTREVAERALVNDIFMPNIGYVNIGDVNAWSTELGGAANSKKLWVNSLVTPHACLAESEGKSEHEYFKKSVELIKAYLSQYDSGQGLFDIAWRDEHAVSNRLFVLCAFIHLLIDVEEAPLSQLDLLYHAERHAQWLSHDEHYVKNNHGVMMDLSLAQYSVLIRYIDPKLSDAYLEVALRRLGMMLNDTFDTQGCCTENSPTYHFVNYSLFLSIFSFLKEYAKEFDLDGWEETLEKAKAVGALFLRPDGTIPLIGDSESKPGTFFPNVEPELSRGVGYYPEAGLFLLSDDNIHFTFRAGGRKFSHRHVDDLSITLWYAGSDFVVDSGLYNYDTTDKLRRNIISSRSHSGLYVKSQEQVLFKNFDSPRDMSGFSSCENLGPLGVKCSASHFLSKECDVHRSLFFKDNVIYIYDSFNSTLDQEWRFQLVLHPDVEVSLGENNLDVVLTHSGKTIVVHCDSGGEGMKVDLESINYSDRFMKLIETTVVVVSGVSKKLALNTSISLG
ncbi:hypothetical protein BGL48_14030 [Salinivibrio sp. SS3]|uniref:heparinase II/III domain-containing protein n=1 Tax=Salinivibrio sp. SS3 TaxID=1895021 RepID=UPI0008482FE1|nr:heparinase II/III family protein [Salinivibrio sp. BNH]ODP97417.1 hypothetical protein BGL48_14030 [Salinivibrio sp. BNH]